MTLKILRDLSDCHCKPLDITDTHSHAAPSSHSGPSRLGQCSTAPWPSLNKCTLVILIIVPSRLSGLRLHYTSTYQELPKGNSTELHYNPGYYHFHTTVRCADLILWKTRYSACNNRVSCWSLQNEVMWSDFTNNCHSTSWNHFCRQKKRAYHQTDCRTEKVIVWKKCIEKMCAVFRKCWSQWFKD